MKVAVQTISWGRRLEDYGSHMFDAIQRIGFDGVEIAQHPTVFGSPQQIYENLRRRKLKLLGFAGGSLGERAKFVQQLIKIEDQALKDTAKPKKEVRETTKKHIQRIICFAEGYPYLYVDAWDTRLARKLIKKKMNLAIHPHMFKPIQTAREAEKLLKDYPASYFLPDTAHLTVAGENIIEVLKRNFAKIIAIHIKDWACEFGRSYQFYSKGFGIQFGEGDVNLNKVIAFLKGEGENNTKSESNAPKANRNSKYRYEGWLIIEQDVADNPSEMARLSRIWLRKNHGV